MQITRLSATPPPSRRSEGEIGVDKNVSQHVGNAGFGLASAHAIVSGLGPASRLARAAQEVPVVNLAIGALETVNFAHQMKKGERVVALGHAGNAAGCYAAFIEDLGRLATVTPLRNSAVATVAVGFGILGGVFGIVQGSHEIRAGLASRRETGQTRTFNMGVCDVASGTVSIAGMALRASGISPTVGTALLVAASVCDLASIGIDYLAAKRSDGATPAS